MQTTETDPAAVDAMLHRATTGMLGAVVLQAGPPRAFDAFDFWQGYAKAAHDLRNGVGQKLAAKDAQLGGYEPPRFLRAAAGVLGVDVYRLPRVEIEQRLAQAGIKVPPDALALGDAEAAKQLEDGAVAAVDLDEEHAVARIDADDGAGLHGEPLVVAGADILADGPGAGQTAQHLLRLHLRGLVIDAQCGKGGVVNLAVRAQQKHKGVFGRFSQHLANALFRAADACHPGHKGRALRVISLHVATTPLDDEPAGLAGDYIREIFPLCEPDGNAHYQALLVHEGVKRHHDGRPVARDSGLFWRKKSADDAHDFASRVVKAANVADTGGAA